MKQLLLFLFLPLAAFGQANNAGRSMSGPSANRPVCSRNLSDENAHNGDVYSECRYQSLWRLRDILFYHL